MPEDPSEQKKELVELFKKKLTALRVEVIECSAGTLPQEITRVLSQRNARTLLIPNAPRILKIAEQTQLAFAKQSRGGEPQSLSIIPFAKPIEDLKATVFAADASLESGDYGLAETGTLVIASGATHPRSLSLVPPLHIVWLRREQVLKDFTELLTRYKDKPMPSNLILISGPSKTADIELTLVHGIHGPRELVVLLTP